MAMTLDTPIPSSIEVLRNKIGWLCTIIRWAIIAYLVWVLYLNLAPLVLKSAADSAIEWTKYWGLKEGSITSGKVYANRAIVMISWAAAAYMGLSVWRLMSAYLEGNIFSVQAAALLRHLGMAALIASIIDIVIRPIVFMVLSPEILQKFNLIELVGPVDLMYILIALFVLALGHIQHTAAAISDEHRQFV